MKYSMQRNLKTFLQDLDCELTELELSVICCLKEQLLDYLPDNLKTQNNADSEISRVIDNYRQYHFFDLLLDNRLFTNENKEK